MSPLGEHRQHVDDGVALGRGVCREAVLACGGSALYVCVSVCLCACVLVCLCVCMSVCLRACVSVCSWHVQFEDRVPCASILYHPSSRPALLCTQVHSDQRGYHSASHFPILQPHTQSPNSKYTISHPSVKGNRRWQNDHDRSGVHFCRASECSNVQPDFTVSTTARARDPGSAHSLSICCLSVAQPPYRRSPLSVLPRHRGTQRCRTNTNLPKGASWHCQHTDTPN